MKRQTGFLLLLFALNIALYALSFSQESDKLLKLRMAQEFEEVGEWERAASLYEELSKSEPNNFIFVDGLQRSYVQIKEYGKAIGIIRQYLKFQPHDVNLMTQLGGIYYDSGNEAAADSIWKSVLAADPRNVQLYRVVANEMMGHRLYEKCIRIYLDGRSMNQTASSPSGKVILPGSADKDDLFSDELGMLYAALQQYGSATQEYLRLIYTSPERLMYVQSRLSEFTEKPGALRTASETVKGEIKNAPDNIALCRLYAWLLIEERKYDSALEQYRIIDRLSNADGYEIFNFGQRLSQEHAYKTAADAFREIINAHKNSSLISYASFGYARASEELIAQTDTASLSHNPSLDISETETQPQPTYKSVIQLYESLAASNPNSDIAAQSLFRIGMIEFDKVFDLDGALKAFKRIKNMPPASNILNDAILKIGDVQVALNNLAEARKEYDRLSKLPVAVYRDQTAFKLAELDYFEAEFDSALSMLKRFNTNLNTDLANDALQLQYFIQENKTTAPQALKQFSRADLLMRQRKFSESLAQFQYIVKSYSTALLIDDALMKIGELHLQLRQPGEAIAAFRFVVDSIQLSILKDHALFRIAKIFQSVINNKAQAIEAYEKLLAQFPNSLYAEEARKTIRILRGDSL